MSGSATAVALAVLLLPQGSKAETRGTYGPWALQCETALNTQKEYCRLSQSTFQDDAQTKRLLQVIIARSGKSQNLGLLIWLPLGISLPMGTFIQLDNGEPLELIVERCEYNGCRIETELAASYLEKLQQSDKASVLVHDRRRNLVELDFSLASLSDALAALRLEIDKGAEKF
ncbi:invasion associated locus B family protein [Rhodovibrionaceae bacterium A322]